MDVQIKDKHKHTLNANHLVNYLRTLPQCEVKFLGEIFQFPIFKVKEMFHK